MDLVGSSERILWHSGGTKQKRLKTAGSRVWSTFNLQGIEGQLSINMKLTGPSAFPIIRCSFEGIIQGIGIEGGPCLSRFNNRQT